MAAVVVDTDVVSFLFKLDTRAEAYKPHLRGKLLTISFMTVAELDRWAIARSWGEARRQQLEAHLRRFIVYHYDRALCRTWAQVSDGARRAGKPIECADAWVAAVAVLHGLPLVTNNADHYAGVSGLQVMAGTAGGV